MTQLKTTTLIFDFENSDFKKLAESIVIVGYDIPPYMKPKKGKDEDYAKLHIWVRQSTEFPYYVNTNIMKLFIGYPSTSEIVDVFSKDGRKIVGEVLTNYYENTADNNYKNADNWMKVLYADYFHQDKEFISNNNFYLKVKSYKYERGTRQYLSVLKLTPRHHYQESKKGHYEFFTNDSATRLRKTTFGERSRKKIPFGFDETPSEELTLRQLKVTKDIDENDEIYEENTSIDYKTKIKFHSISNVEKYESSRSVKLDRFLTGFIEYLRGRGLIVKQKEMHLINPLKELQPSGKMYFNEFIINVLDYRFNKEKSIDNILEVFNKTYLELYKDDKVKFVNQPPNDDDSLLILMDYSKDDFDGEHLAHRKDDDGYKIVKKEFTNFPSQGFCINPNALNSKKAELGEEQFLDYEVIEKVIKNSDIRRNFQVCLRQVFLKNLVFRNIDIQEKLPHFELIKDLVFIKCVTVGGKRHQIILFVEDNQLKIERIKNRRTPTILKKCDIQFLNDLEELRKKYDKHSKWSKNEINFILSKDFIWEIKELPERILYPNVFDVLDGRERKRPKQDFLLPEIENSYFLIEQIASYNQFIQTEVLESEISYEGLVGSGKGKYRNEVFRKLGILKEGKRPNDSKFAKALCTIGQMEIKGKRAGNPFETHQGVWFDRDNLQYFVGKQASYKYNQSTGFQVRKIIVHKGEFDETIFFPLLNVEFVRYKGYTVLPYLFNLMNIYLTERKVEEVSQDDDW